ncbi:MAG: NADPH-dependent oxidoreductase [Rhodospirillales bacterium CG15_BIG_FIL_POST_REV_8_21_14_020_66_15]|nr:MAG: NADPH-dependent oxidoreductase [Rhodospirillales bacterium CG15_BIG_FIL_POST_REV_8_21_14_020_66_15]
MPFRNDLFLGRFGLNPRFEDTDLLLDEPVARMIGRRVCRRYGREEVSDGLLETLLAAAQSAPAKSDLQQYSIVVTDKDQQRALSDMIGSMPWIADASRFLVFCADMHRGQRIAELRGKEHVNNTLDTFMNAAVDAALAMMAFITAADFKGLGSCPISAVRAHTAEVCSLLGLPKGVFPVSGLTLGYPTDDGRFTLRLPPSVVVHHGTYDDANLEEDLRAYDARRNRLQPIPPERQMHKDDFGISDDYGWTENTARRLAKRERADFGDFIRAHGFDLE